MSMNEEQSRESGQSGMVHNTENTQKTSENNVVIEFKNVTFGYHEEATVHSLNVKVKKGDFTAIIGSNGAGKTTFSKLCNGLIKPQEGDVFIFGKNTRREKVSNIAHHVGFLFQNPDRQICCGTVRQEIEFSLRNNGLPHEEIMRRTQETLDTFGFDGEAEPFNLSRGQRQRLCLACLIALNPEILILDEPTTGLDYRECMELMEKIRSMNKAGTTVIMVCHDMEVVLDFSQKIILMTDGRIAGEGETRKILADEELLKSAHVIPPQIAQTCSLLGDQFRGIFTADEMIERISALKGGAK